MSTLRASAPAYVPLESRGSALNAESSPSVLDVPPEVRLVRRLARQPFAPSPTALFPTASAMGDQHSTGNTPTNLPR